MFYIFKEWKLMWSSINHVSQEWCETIEYEFTQEEINKLERWYIFKDWELQETDESLANDKIDAIQDYKTKQLEIQEIKWELQDINETISEKSEAWQKLLWMRKKVLEDRLVEVRANSEEIALSWVERFWVGIISEF